VKAAADRLPDPPATAAQEQARRTASI
jgi:hypothetical protein